MNVTKSNVFNKLPDDHEVETRARAVFRDACDQLGPYYNLKLGLARRKALNAGPERIARRVWAPLAGGAMACCALAIGLVVMRPSTSPSTTGANTTQGTVATAVDGGAEAAVELDNTQVEMMQNLDFYRWLATQPASPAASNGSAN